MAAKFTPGPWRVFEHENPSAPGWFYWDVYAKDPSPGTDHEIVILDHCSREADANLIAAAPALYEACRTLIDYVDSGYREGVGVTICNQIRAALALAEIEPE